MELRRLGAGATARGRPGFSSQLVDARAETLHLVVALPTAASSEAWSAVFVLQRRLQLRLLHGESCLLSRLLD